MIIGIILAAAVVWAVVTMNGFKRKEIKIDEALSGIEVALTKRYDTLTKLLDITKGFMKHESELMENVIHLRRGMSVGEMGEADRQMGELTGRIMAVAENYPELRSSDIFVQLQHGVRDAEEHLQAARRLYNANVSNFNISIAMFPARLLAGGYKAKEFYEAEDEKKEDVKMKFE